MRNKISKTYHCGTLTYTKMGLFSLFAWLLGDDICGLLQRNSEFLRSFTPATVTIELIAVFLIMFQFFNMFVGSVFWYLFNDVVPAQFLSRFMGACRVERGFSVTVDEKYEPAG